MTIDATKVFTERAIGVGALVLAVLAPAIVSGFWLNSILTQALILGIGAASLIFLSAYGGMISLAQTGLMGIAGLRAREHGHAERSRRRDQGSPARLGSDAGARRRDLC